MVAVVALLFINPLLPANSNDIKNQALTTLIETGEEVFTEDGQVTTNGLCIFLVFNQSYLEAVSDPAWEFQCFDTATAFAGEVRLNDGSYRCMDSVGRDIRAERSVIYGPECLEADDRRLNDDRTFPTTYVFYRSNRVVDEGVDGNVTKTPEVNQVIDETVFNCGVINADYSQRTQGRLEGMRCLSQNIMSDCAESAFKLSGSPHGDDVFTVGQNDAGECVMTFNYSHSGRKERVRRSGSCVIERVLSEGVDESYCNKQSDFSASTSICAQRQYNLDDWKSYYEELAVRQPSAGNQMYDAAWNNVHNLLSQAVMLRDFPMDSDPQPEAIIANHGCTIVEY